jgi:hypothetical protein
MRRQFTRTAQSGETATHYNDALHMRLLLRWARSGSLDAHQ